MPSPIAVKTIIRKEWAELYKNTLVLGTVVFLPLFLAALPLLILWASGDIMGGTAEAVGSELPPQMGDLCRGLSSGECGQLLIVSQFTLFFMMIPLFIPATIAPYSIVGEKTQRSLEPLLATPISTVELLLGKNLAAVIPAVLATWFAYAFFAIGARLLVASPQVFSRLFGPDDLLQVLVIGPLLAVFSVDLAIMISSRSNDARVAQQISSLVVLPIVFLFIGQLAGILVFNTLLTYILLLAAFFIDIILTYLSVHVFDRETILTRWS
ncbi:MAG: ABC transporter permease [Caldilineae bacterium]|nr:MAG: ABC transporter permease [Caldilineae bacterium]